MAEPQDYSRLIVGARNIARFLGIRNRKAVYHMMEKKRAKKSDIPVWKEPGLGIVANREILLSYMKERSGFRESRDGQV